MFGINPIIIDSFKISHQYDGVHIWIRLIKNEQTCPICGTRTTKVVSYVDKHIKHSVITTNRCFIDYHARRYKCIACNKTFYEMNPFTFGKERISAATVYSVLTDLKNPNETFKSVGDRYHLSSTTVIKLFDQYIDTPRGHMPYALNIDEVYIPTSDKDKYLCILLDFKTMKIVDVLPSRHKYVLSDYFSNIPLDERNRVKVMSSDMWRSYHDISKTFLHEAERSIDSFHLLMEFSKQFSSVRCKTMKKYALIKNTYQKEKEIRKLKPDEYVTYQEAKIKYYALKKFNWLFYSTRKDALDPNKKKRYNSVFHRYLNFYDIFTYICSCDKELEEACDLKYELDTFFKNSTIDNAKENIENLIIVFKTSSIPEMRHFAGTLAGWKNEIINSFIIVDGSTINNGRIECINRKIKTLKRNANGYTNFERLKKRIMWCVNKNGVIDITTKGENRNAN